MGLILALILLLLPAAAQATTFTSRPNTTCTADTTRVNSPALGDACLDSTTGQWYFGNGGTWYPSQGGVVDVRLFGAKGDGSTNDAAAIQAAINYALNTVAGTVNFPPATYVITSKLTIPITAQNFAMTGYGATIRCKVNDDCLAIGDTTSTNSHNTNIVIKGLFITGNGATDVSQPAQNCLAIYSALGMVLRDVQVSSCPNIGIKVQKSGAAGSAFLDMVLFDHVFVRFTGFQGLSYCETGAGGACDDITIVNSLFNNLGQQQTNASNALGAVFINANTFTIVGSEFSTIQNVNGTQGYGPSLQLNNGNGLLAGLHFENNGANQANSVDILLATGSDGTVLSGINIQESQSTGVNTGVRVRASHIQIHGISQCSSAGHQIATVIDGAAASALDLWVSGMATCSGGLAPGTFISTTNGSGTFISSTNQITTYQTSGAVSVLNNGYQIGAPTGGDKGVGTLNAATRLYQNGVAMVQPAGADGTLRLTGFTFANIATSIPNNGDMGFCSDCTLANPCAGGGTGAFAKRLNGVNVCN